MTTTQLNKDDVSDADDILYPPSWVSKRWNRSEAALACERSMNKGPAYLKFGSSVRYRLSDILAYERKYRKPTLDMQ